MMKREEVLVIKILAEAQRGEETWSWSTEQFTVAVPAYFPRGSHWVPQELVLSGTSRSSTLGAPKEASRLCHVPWMWP